MAKPKTKAEKASATYKKKRRTTKDATVGSKTTGHKVKKKDLPKKTGMRSYTSKIVLG